MECYKTKRTRDWFQVCGIQVPLEGTKFGLIRRILLNHTPVKNQNRFVEKAIEHFGTTYSWKETGYLLPDGKKLDFFGKHWGGQDGYRSVDHRDVSGA